MSTFVQRIKLALRPYRRGLAAWRAARAHNAQASGTPLWFSPELPAPKSGMFAVAQATGRPVRRGVSDTEPTFAWGDRTVMPAPSAALRAADAINVDCTDISKHHVDEVHGEVFGRALTVDPLTHVGPMVEKSDDNAVHDGRIVEGPLTSTVDGCVYQRVVDATDGDEAVDLRVAVTGDRLAFVLEKRRPITDRFSNDNSRVIVCSDDVFTSEERRRLVALARGLGMDLGEFDVLRDRNDGLIWVVDANKTPYLRPAGLSEEDRQATVAALVEALEATLLSC
ncbi:MAG: hypothetical protein AAGA90_12775 [Actinomycetota bacterium]